MVDYYATNAYSRSNANTNNNNNNNNNNTNNSNGYYSNVNNNENPYASYSGNTSQTQTGQPSQQSQQQQPSSSIPIPSLWNPNPVMATALSNVASNVVNNVVKGGGGNGEGTNNSTNEAMYRYGIQVTNQFLGESTARLIPGLETFMKTLRIYFAVDNGYVKRKMMRVLFSFLYKNWMRLVSRN